MTELVKALREKYPTLPSERIDLEVNVDSDLTVTAVVAFEFKAADEAKALQDIADTFLG
jgi:hypothetical protein